MLMVLVAEQVDLSLTSSQTTKIGFLAMVPNGATKRCIQKSKRIKIRNMAYSK